MFVLILCNYFSYKLNPLSESAETGNKIDESVSEVTNNGGNEEIPFSVRLAMEKAKEYKKTKETIAGSSGIGETFLGNFLFEKLWCIVV